jgi:hypothetical protein
VKREIHGCGRCGLCSSWLLRMKFELSHGRRNIADDAILQDMKRVSELIGNPVLRQRDYGEHGKFAVKTAINRFASWAAAVEYAGLTKSADRQISDIQLFENLLLLWTALGRQPLYSEVQKPDSNYHVATYERRFGSWRAALETFAEWANTEEHEAPSEDQNLTTSIKRKTQRQPNLRLCFRVLNRDRFTCCACGASPATSLGTRLQVDHIVPWSKGGETVEENLQALCEKCNQGKSDLLTKI